MAGERTGYFGGTFDPPHLGHEILAQEALYQLNLDAVMWLITPDPPHKKKVSISPVEQRLEMLELVTSREPAFMISLIDLDRPAPHYAADTVEIIKDKDPSLELIYIIGEDSLRDLPGWYQPARLLAAVDQLGVAPRPGIHTNLDDLEKELPGITKKTSFLSGVMLEISSSLIRERAKQGAPFRHFLNPAVADYLEESGVYSPKTDLLETK